VDTPSPLNSQNLEVVQLLQSLVDATKLKLNPIPTTTAGRNGSYAVIGSLQICFGTDLVSSAGTTITFARPFSSGPTVVATVLDPGTQTAMINSTPSASSVSLRQSYTGGSLTVCWIAIGTAP
jgi:hypothetical protein